MIIALMIAVFIPHVCAENVTYPQEYYEYKAQADRASVVNFNNPGYINVNAGWASDYRTAAILIAIEKQNELIDEQNKLLANLTITEYCMPSDGNTIPPIKWHCEKALGNNMI